MAMGTLNIGSQAKVFTIPEESVKGVKYLTDEYNRKNNTSINPVEFITMQIVNWAGDAANVRRQEFRKRFMIAFDASSPDVKTRVLTELNLTEP